MRIQHDIHEQPQAINTGALLLRWISNHMPNNMWDEITYPFPNFNGAAVDVWEWISDFIPHLIIDVITYPCCD